MPAKSLRDIIRDQDGQLLLGQTASPGVAAQSPTAAAGQGASPDAAKMAGTPASGGAAPGIGAPTPDQGAQAPAPQPLAAGTAAGAGAVQAQVPETQRLREVMRREAAVAQSATAEQADKQAEAARMQTQFGDLGTRVQTLIDKYLVPPAPSTPPGDPSAVDPGAPAPTGVVAGIVGDVSKLTPEQQAAVQLVASTGGTPESIAAAKKLGIDPFAYITNSQNISTGVGAAAAALTPDKIMLDDATIQQLGYTPDSLAAALGVDVSALAGMNLEQMQQQMETRLRAEYSTARDAASRATDPSLGPNERAAARAELKQLGAAGIFATEADMHRLEESIDAADEITFAGKSMTIEEVLDDDFMTGLVKDYVDSPPDSDARKRLREDAPELAAWIDQHESALREASIQLEGASTKYNEIQASATKVVDGLTPLGVSPDLAQQLLSALIPGYTEGQLTEAVDLTQFPGLSFLTDPNVLSKAGVDPQMYAADFAQIAAVSPEVAAELAKMSPSDLQAIGAGIPGDPRFKNYVQYVKRWEGAQELDDSDPESVIDYIFGPAATVDGIKKLWEQEQAKARLGIPSKWYSEMSGILDANKDGQLDDAAMLSTSLKEQMGSSPLAPSKYSPTALGAKLDAAQAGSIPQGEMHPAATPLLDAMRDGELTSAELASLGPNAPSDVLATVYKNGSVSKEVKDQIGEVLTKRQTGESYTRALNKFNLRPSDLDSPSKDRKQEYKNALQALDQGWAAQTFRSKTGEAQYLAYRKKILDAIAKVGG